MMPTCEIIYILLMLSCVLGQRTTCFCDLNIGLCDVNCCCDTEDCSTSDIETFTCLVPLTNADTLHCVYDQVVFVNNIAQTQTVRQNGLFCIEVDNFATRNMYTLPACISSDTCFDDIGQIYFYNVSTNVPQATESFYQSGDIVYTIFNNSNAQSMLTLPSSGVSNVCQDNNPVKYLSNESNSCSRSSSDLMTSCNTDYSLDFAFYAEGFKIVPSPSLLNLTGNSEILFNDTELVSISASCTLNNINTTECVSPVYNATTTQCENVVTSATYTIGTNGTNGISSVDLQIDLSMIGEASFPLTQQFAINFVSIQNTGTVLQLSGNPGYLIGRPLLTAVCDSAGVPQSFNSNPNVGVTLVTPTATGLCSASEALTRQAILFGQDQTTGCMTALSTSTCQQIQQEIFATLDGQIFNQNGSVCIGSYGNTTDLTSTADWTQVIKADSESLLISVTETNTGCQNMILSSVYEILFANAGNISDPQPKVVGARYSYGNPQFLQFRCIGGNCDRGTNQQRVEISTSVTFIDISETPVSLETQRPTIEAKLPNDFFSPFKDSVPVN
ncbi:tectonic-3-like [Clavelina lepadiformis]|uniref:tectonic-3-like n=1 Tax=Clavelina lepadiformis TaxID=159417 RepID=UPI00404207EC